MKELRKLETNPKHACVDKVHECKAVARGGATGACAPLLKKKPPISFVE